MSVEGEKRFTLVTFSGYFIFYTIFFILAYFILLYIIIFI